MVNTKSLILTALCIALGIVLPLAFHAVPNAGMILLPMHMPVLLCGLLVGPFAGLVCGVLTPVLSFFCTSMPPAPMLPSMVCELALYGLLSGLFIKLLRNKPRPVSIYISMIASMIAGRIAYGLLNALIFKAGSYSLQIWVSSMFVTALPGIIIQILIVPVIVIALNRAGINGYERQPQ